MALGRPLHTPPPNFLRRDPLPPAGWHPGVKVDPRGLPAIQRACALSTAQWALLDGLAVVHACACLGRRTGARAIAVGGGYWQACSSLPGGSSPIALVRARKEMVSQITARLETSSS